MEVLSNVARVRASLRWGVDAPQEDLPRIVRHGHQQRHTAPDFINSALTLPRQHRNIQTCRYM